MSRTRSAVLAGAARVIISMGVRSTTMTQIALESGVAKATVYNHFRTKDEVLAALLEVTVTALLEPAATAPGPAEALASVAAALSQDPVLAALRAREPAVLSRLACPGDRPELWPPLWRRAAEAAARVLPDHSPAARAASLRWVAAFALWPGTPTEIEQQARWLAVPDRVASGSGDTEQQAPPLP